MPLIGKFTTSKMIKEARYQVADLKADILENRKTRQCLVFSFNLCFVVKQLFEILINTLF